MRDLHSGRSDRWQRTSHRLALTLHQGGEKHEPLGLLEGQCQVPDDFDQMAAEAIADLFEAR